jgi:hypothetical protein
MDAFRVDHAKELAFATCMIIIVVLVLYFLLAAEQV